MRMRCALALVMVLFAAMVPAVAQKLGVSAGFTPTWEPPTPQETAEALAGLPFDGFVDEAYRHILLHHPETVTFHRLADEFGVRDDRWMDLSAEGREAYAAVQDVILQELDRFDEGQLDEQQRLTIAVLRDELSGPDASEPSMTPTFTVDSTSAHVYPFKLLTTHQPLENADDVKDYLVRMHGIGDWIEGAIDREERKLESGCPTSWYVLDEALSTLRELIPFGSERHLLVVHLEENLSNVVGLDADGRADALARAEELAVEIVSPAYERLKESFGEWMAKAPRAFGAGSCPMIAEAYRDWIEGLTKVSVEEIHELAKADVIAMRDELNRLSAAEVADAHLGPVSGPDTSCTLVTPEVAFAEYGRLVDLCERRCRELFTWVPATPLTVELVPWRSVFASFLAYYRKSPAGSDAEPIFGIGYSESTDVVDVSQSLVVHEVYPGHFLQDAYAQRMNLPLLRQVYSNSFYVEGWATYAETLAWEQGWFAEDYCAKRDHLSLRLSHAVLAVLDTGLNVLGWDRHDAQQFIRQAYGQLTSFRDLYAVSANPGLYLDYWLGLHTFRVLRAKTETALADSFDLRAFHDVVLRNGVLPLPVLEDVVNAYIKEVAAP